MSITLVIIKPDAIRRHLVGEIIARFERAGLSIDQIKMINKAPQKLLQEHYADVEERHGKKIFNRAVKHMQSGPIIVMVVMSHGDTPAEVRKLVGETLPEKASPGTIRGDFASISAEYCDERDMGVQNLIHASSSHEEAAREIALWFRSNLCH